MKLIEKVCQLCLPLKKCTQTVKNITPRELYPSRQNLDNKFRNALLHTHTHTMCIVGTSHSSPDSALSSKSGTLDFTPTSMLRVL